MFSSDKRIGNNKLMRKRNNEICNKAVIKLIKTCLVVFFLVAIGNMFTIQSTILLWIVGIVDVIVCLIALFTIIKKWFKANKEGKIIDEDL
jgi:predicted permease